MNICTSKLQRKLRVARMVEIEGLIEALKVARHEAESRYSSNVQHIATLEFQIEGANETLIQLQTEIIGGAQ